VKVIKKLLTKKKDKQN